MLNGEAVLIASIRIISAADTAMIPALRLLAISSLRFSTCARHCSPALDDEGEVGGVVVTVSETTAAVERARSDVAHIESEERLRIALEAADLGTRDLDLTTDTAAARSLRYDQIFGHKGYQAAWGKRLPCDTFCRRIVPCFRKRLLAPCRREVISCEVRVRWPDGSIRWIAQRGRTYYGSEGRPVRMALD